MQCPNCVTENPPGANFCEEVYNSQLEDYYSELAYHYNRS